MTTPTMSSITLSQSSTSMKPSAVRRWSAVTVRHDEPSTAAEISSDMISTTQDRNLVPKVQALRFSDHQAVGLVHDRVSGLEQPLAVYFVALKLVAEQVVLCGDSYQLPPVRVGQNGCCFGFEARCWSSVAPGTSSSGRSAGRATSPSSNCLTVYESFGDFVCCIHLFVGEAALLLTAPMSSPRLLHDGPVEEMEEDDSTSSI